MLLERLELQHFRNYAELRLELSPGVTVVTGNNGHGKSNLLEAIGYLATLSSFRGAPIDALIADGADAGVIRAEGVRAERALLLEAEILRVGRNRTLINRQPLKRTNDLLGALRVTVFSPDDLEMVKQGPGLRRRFFDELLVAIDPRNDVLRTDLDKVLRQRNALLKQAKGRLREDIAVTLDVWDAKLAEVGTALAVARREAVDALEPHLVEAYRALSGNRRRASVAYDPEWMQVGLADALAHSRTDDVRRGVSTVGPHRDEFFLALDGSPVRTHASQGEQRSFTLAMRLAAHLLVTERAGASPILLLDDVFSELDATRSAALLANLPAGQTLVTTAGIVPEGTHPDVVWQVRDGVVSPSSLA